MGGLFVNAAPFRRLDWPQEGALAEAGHCIAVDAARREASEAGGIETCDLAAPPVRASLILLDLGVYDLPQAPRAIARNEEREALHGIEQAPLDDEQPVAHARRLLFDEDVPGSGALAGQVERSSECRAGVPPPR